MIINSMVYRKGGESEKVDIDAISEVIKEPDAFIWLGLWQPEPEFMNKVQKEFGLHELTIEDALTAHQRPKIEQYGESIFIVVKTVHETEGRLALVKRICLSGRTFSSQYVMVRQTVMRRSERAPRKIRQCWRTAQGIRSTAC